MKINITKDKNGVVNGYILIPLNEATAIDITEEEFKKLNEYLENEVPRNS